MRPLTRDQLQLASGGCNSWYHIFYCDDSEATQAEYEMQYGSQPASRSTSDEPIDWYQVA